MEKGYGSFDSADAPLRMTDMGPGRVIGTGHASGGLLSCSDKKVGKEPAREGEDSESLPSPWTHPSFKRPNGDPPLLDFPAKRDTLRVSRNRVP